MVKLKEAVQPEPVEHRAAVPCSAGSLVPGGVLVCLSRNRQSREAEQQTNQSQVQVDSAHAGDDHRTCQTEFFSP